MRRTAYCLTILVLLVCLPASAQWKIPANAPLLTRWSREVKPDNVLPEYPRPQMVRPRWMTLNGLWQFVEATDG
ncbi:MAG TPA: hypothetical protein VMM37_01180, partial [Bacteroidota bacterium]|nr:hypothetical protein [Bacteroidota bacterium]